MESGVGPLADLSDRTILPTAQWGRKSGMHMLAHSTASRQIKTRQMRQTLERQHLAIMGGRVLPTAKTDQCPREDLNLHPVTWTRT